MSNLKFMNTRLLLSLAALSALCGQIQADTSAPPEEEPQSIFRLDVAARVDFQWDAVDGHTQDANTGFEAKYLMFRIDGQIVKGLTYSWRQRLNKLHKDQAFFDATDWIYLNYAFRGWEFQAGKQVVGIGGWEYDRNPMDLYDCSVFWNNIPCYDLGVSVSRWITPSDKLLAQVTQSPFFTSDNRNMYAYNLMWQGNHGCFHPLYSLNLIEYEKGRYINYIALGNRFTFDKVEVEVDLMNRASSHQTFLFRDCSVMGEIAYSPTDRWRVFGKMTYDVNKSGTDADYTVSDGTELTMAGAGVEFYPLRKGRHSLRLHAGCFYSWGANANTENLMQDRSLFACVGLTWNMNILNINKK